MPVPYCRDLYESLVPSRGEITFAVESSGLQIEKNNNQKIYYFIIANII